MKIKKLNMECGKCAMLEYCGEPWRYAICEDERFADIDDRKYAKIAEMYTHDKAKKYGVQYEPLPECEEREKKGECEGYYCINCEVHTGQHENCEHFEEANDNHCWAIADYVEAVLKERGKL